MQPLAATSVKEASNEAGHVRPHTSEILLSMHMTVLHCEAAQHLQMLLSVLPLPGHGG